MLAFTNEKMQKMYNAKEPYYARILKRNLYSSPTNLKLPCELPMIFECEVAFKMRSDLPKRVDQYRIEEVAAAVDSMLPSVEIPVSNFRKPFELQLPTVVAANGIDGPLICGNPVKEWAGLDRANLPITLHVNGKKRTAGSSSEAMGDPLKALTWFANRLIENGKGLRSGEIINTGVCGEPIECKCGDEAIADFGALGTVRVTIQKIGQK
jgi:2-keto-4-pentenoate hydratase